MRKSLKKFLKQCNRLGYSPVVKRAPNWVVTFDRMVIVYVDDTRRQIWMLKKYDSRTDTMADA